MSAILDKILCTSCLLCEIKILLLLKISEFYDIQRSLSGKYLQISAWSNEDDCTLTLTHHVNMLHLLQGRPLSCLCPRYRALLKAAASTSPAHHGLTLSQHMCGGGMAKCCQSQKGCATHRTACCACITWTRKMRESTNVSLPTPPARDQALPLSTILVNTYHLPHNQLTHLPIAHWIWVASPRQSKRWQINLKSV